MLSEVMADDFGRLLARDGQGGFAGSKGIVNG